MLPFQKSQWFLGCAGLSMIMEQDRRHWLLKTDRLKQIEDSTTGSTFQGQIENAGSEIYLETEKLPTLHISLADTSFTEENVKDVFDIGQSSLPFSYETNVMGILRLLSTQYQYNETTKKNFKIQFTYNNIVHVPTRVSSTSNDVVALTFLKSARVHLLLPDANDQFTIQIPVQFSDLTHVAFYFPLDDFRPFDVDDIGNDTYVSELISDDNLIGYPAIWFTCDELSTGPVFKFTANNMMHYGNPTESKYQVKVYTALSADDMYSGYDIDTYTIMAFPTDGYEFTNTAADFNIPLSLTRLTGYTTATSPSTIFQFHITSENNNVLTMDNISNGWVFVDATALVDAHYELALTDVDNTSNVTNKQPLIPLFDLALDQSVPFGHMTKDIGAAGIVLTSESISGQYPFDLNQWNGLPEWINASKERLVAYAVHNTPDSVDDDPMSKQTAGLLFDPGTPVTTSSDELDYNEIGRVYVLSNDDAEYHNNDAIEFPKPERTVARICDVPTSVMQLSNLHGIAPTPIVDPKYVRSEASFTEDDESRIYNDPMKVRWVRPTSLNHEGLPVCGETGNQYVFQSPEDLNSVDLINYNDFREYTNLNQSVPVTDISVAAITNPGTFYSVNDVGTIVIGGYALTYIVDGVADGAVTSVRVEPDDPTNTINLANFDMTQGSSGLTQPYGTSPLTGEGTGLKIQFLIANYTDLLPTRGNVYDGLFAFVQESDGLWLYAYNTSTHRWVQITLISAYETSDTTTNVSLRDAYINSITPSVRKFPVSCKEPGKNTDLKVLTTASFVNVIDDTKTPVTVPTGYNDDIENRTVIDINKFVCTQIKTGVSVVKTFSGIVQAIKQIGDGRFDSYLIWRWKSESPTNLAFEYGYVHRSFNNLQSTDSTTFLPKNELRYDKFVHTNASTTISWNLPLIGPMIWTYNPRSFTHESYDVNASTHDLYVVRTPSTWENVEIYNTSTHQKIDLYDTDGNLLWNIAHNTTEGTGAIQTPIYSQPEFTLNPTFMSVGKPVSEIPAYLQPKGAWELVFPRIQSFKFKNDVTDSTYTPIRLNVIRGTSITDTTEVIDQYGEPINSKVMIIDDTSTTTTLKVYNPDTGMWVTI